MCSSILNVVFIIVLLVGTGLLVASLVTPAWEKIENNAKVTNITGIIDSLATAGIFGCPFVVTSAQQPSVKECFMNKPTWQKIQIACMLLALLACGLAFVWSIIVCCMCCCKCFLTPPLPIFAGLATILLIIGVTLFGINSKKDFNIFDDLKHAIDSKSPDPLKHSFGYSMYLAIASIIVLCLDTIIGIILVKTSKVAPI